MASATAPRALTFYTYPLAFNPAKVAVMLAEKKLPHKTVKVDLLGGGSLAPSFVKLNPSGAVPVLVDNGKVVLESKAICKLIDGIDDAPLGGDKVDRVWVDKFVEEIDAWDGNLWAFTHSPPGIASTLESLGQFRKKVAAARAAQNPDLKEVYEKKIKSMEQTAADNKDKAKVEANEKQLVGLLDVAEERLTPKEGVSEDLLFLGGPAYSIADAMFAPILYRVFSMGSYKELIAPRAAVSAYMKRVRSRPSWNAAFGEATSTWGKVSNFVPTLVKVKFCNLLRWY